MIIGLHSVLVKLSPLQLRFEIDTYVVSISEIAICHRFLSRDFILSLKYVVFFYIKFSVCDYIYINIIHGLSIYLEWTNKQNNSIRTETWKKYRYIVFHSVPIFLTLICMRDCCNNLSLLLRVSSDLFTVLSRGRISFQGISCLRSLCDNQWPKSELLSSQTNERTNERINNNRGS